MNAYMERVIGSIQIEALDNFIIFNQKQLFNITTNIDLIKVLVESLRHLIFVLKLILKNYQFFIWVTQSLLSSLLTMKVQLLSNQVFDLLFFYKLEPINQRINYLAARIYHSVLFTIIVICTQRCII